MGFVVFVCSLSGVLVDFTVVLCFCGFRTLN